MKKEIKKIIIKNICASCGLVFENSKEHYCNSGNYCRNCCERISNMMKWKALHNNENKTRKQELEYKTLTRLLARV